MRMCAGREGRSKQLDRNATSHCVSPAAAIAIVAIVMLTALVVIAVVVDIAVIIFVL